MIGFATLELANVGFPFGLAGQPCKSCHVAGEVKVINNVHNHEQQATSAIDLHVEDANLTLTFNNFRPNNTSITFFIMGLEDF